MSGIQISNMVVLALAAFAATWPIWIMRRLPRFAWRDLLFWIALVPMGLLFLFVLIGTIKDIGR